MSEPTVTPSPTTKPRTGISSADAQSQRRRRLLFAALFALALVLCVVTAMYWRLSVIFVPSLWLDDQWATLAVEAMSIGEFLTYLPPMPLGFFLLLKGATAIIEAPTWPMLLLPAVFAVALVALGPWLAGALAAPRAAGLIVAGLLAVNQLLALYASRVKPYTLDALITALMVIVGFPLLRRWHDGRAWLLAMGGGDGAAVFVHLGVHRLSGVAPGGALAMGAPSMPLSGCGCAGPGV